MRGPPVMLHIRTLLAIYRMYPHATHAQACMRRRHPPHLRLENLNIGTLSPGSAVPSSDDPAVDPAAYAALRPWLSELLLLGVNAALGFAPLVVAGEKAGCPVHQHVPMNEHAESGTSVSFRRPIAVHTEDMHVQRVYGHFALFGKLGNAAAHTPLRTVRSFLARIRADERGWVQRAMALPFLMRPGAGRMDAAAERLVASMLELQWDGRTVLRYNAADYKSLRDGRRILRIDALPAEWYRDGEQAAAAVRVLPLLRALFADVDGVAVAPPSAASSHALASFALRSGDLLIVSNKAGPHCRTTFAGPRYVQRLYADYSAQSLWDPSLRCATAEQRMARLAARVARDFDAEQLAHLERHLDMPLPAMPLEADEPDDDDDAASVAEAGAALAALEAAIDDVAHLLMEDGPGSPAVTPGACDHGGLQPRDLLEPLRRLHRRLGAVRRAAAWRSLPAPAVAELRACGSALAPLAFRLRDDNLSAELARVRAAVARPGAIDAAAAAVKAAAAALDSCVVVAEDAGDEP